MSVFSSEIRYKPWLWQVTLLSMILGALLALSLKTQDDIRRKQLGETRPNRVAAAYSELRDTSNEQAQQIASLRKRLQKYQEAAAESADTPNARLLQEDLKKANIQAGLVALTGPGVVVVLRDSKKLPPREKGMSTDTYLEITRPYNIHDDDVMRVVNELRGAGAEAISVNDQRVVASTAIRCVGPTIQVNAVSTAPPVTIRAIGDRQVLSTALEFTGGIADQFNMVATDMFTLEKADMLTVPAFSGVTPLRFANPASESKADAAQRQSERAAKEVTDKPLVPVGDR
jgi:uncharacterized protein YlxW (UPF0749 family)